MKKQEVYVWKNSALALFGSDIERNAKKEAANTEKAWKNAGQKEGVQIWRIVNFKVQDWPKEDYGNFYSGDSYIVLNTYRSLASGWEYDLHFWIGKHSTQDEYGTAAYKTVELDTYLHDQPVQHREVQEHESKLFRKYFKKFTYWEGGADSGFRRVKPENYTPRLLHFHGDKHRTQVTEKSMSRKHFKQEDVYILDLGLKLYQWNGVEANKDERYHAGQYLHQLRSERKGRPKIQIFDNQYSDNLHGLVKDVIPEDAGESEASDEEYWKNKASETYDNVLFRLSDRSGQMKFQEVARGDDVSASLLDSTDVFILDTGDHCYAWIGSSASVDERRSAMQYAHNYLVTSKNPIQPVTCLSEGQRNQDFTKAIN